MLHFHSTVVSANYHPAAGTIAYHTTRIKQQLHSSAIRSHHHPPTNKRRRGVGRVRRRRHQRGEHDIHTLLLILYFQTLAHPSPSMERDAFRPIEHGEKRMLRVLVGAGVAGLVVSRG